MTVLLCGIESEPPLALIAKALAERRTPTIIFNQRQFLDADFTFSIANGLISGSFTLHGQTYPLGEISGVYVRLIDEEVLPEIRDLPPLAPSRSRCRSLHNALLQWLEITPSRVVNRCAPMATNASKPYQTQLIAQEGFAIPETLITNDPSQVLDFYERHRRVVYKSISGVRSIVQEVTSDDLRRLDHIRWCPTQFQMFVEGTNIRVHVIDERVFATEIITEATDYRYARRQGSEATLRSVELSDDLIERCVRLAKTLDLPFAGIDLKITPDGTVFCFEVNPSPGFNYYEAQTGQPIAATVAEYLSTR